MDQKESETYDIFRDSPLRFLGYANELGESFRYQFPRMVMPSYVVAFGYCIADAATNGIDAWNSAQRTVQDHRSMIPPSQEGQDRVLREVARATIDTLLWQSFASVAIPGATINLIVKTSRLAVRRSPLALPQFVIEWGPTAAGLSSIPIIVKPIDWLVDYAMDNSFRHVWEKAV